MCFGCSKNLSHVDGSFEYQQHMFWLRNKKNVFKYTLLSEAFIKSNPYLVVSQILKYSITTMNMHQYVWILEHAFTYQ